MITRLSKFVSRYAHRIVSRWLILAIDMVLISFSFVIAYLLRFNFMLNEIRLNTLEWQLLMYAGVFLVSFLVFQPYRGIVRHTSLWDAFTVFLSVSVAVAVLFLFNTIWHFFNPGSSLRFATSILLIAYMASLFSLLSLRFAVKVFYISMMRYHDRPAYILVFGAGELGMSTRVAVESNVNTKLRVVGYVDDNRSKVGKNFSGVPVYSPEMIDRDFIARRGVSEMIIAVQNITAARRQEIIEYCLELGIELRTVPRMEEWLKGTFTYKQIRKVKLEELLGREPIKLENEYVRSMVKGKTVMVTGAAGSIGGELVRQLTTMDPGALVLVDQAETPLFELQQQQLSTRQGRQVTCYYVLADISQEESMHQVFNTYCPDIIYHAAAYKHVPMLEYNPMEAVRVNVFGTISLIRLAKQYGTQKFVMISTDKAVNPSSIMGASKRIAELMVQSMNLSNGGATRYITTRFGNVLGSSGSVIPIFEKQIANGGPVTVTHPDMIRFFMTIPEACELVLEASVMGKGGEIFVFDMGKQLRIVDVAQKMIRLSGFEPGKDIEIVFCGLRPGEKLFEELFSDKEMNMPTHHPKIMIATFNEYPFHQLHDKLNDLGKALKNRDIDHMAEVIREIVPEYDKEIFLNNTATTPPRHTDTTQSVA